MKRRIALLGLLVVGILVLVAGVSAPVMAQLDTVKDLGLVTMANGRTLHCYEVSPPSDTCTGLITQQPDGTVRAQYFKTVAEYDAAVASLGYREESTATTQSGSDVGTGGRAATLSQRSKTLTARLYQGGTSYNMLSSRLTWQYNGSSATYATWWASAGWTSPWTHYGSSDNSLGPYPASSVLHTCTQFYTWPIVGDDYVNVIQNKIRGYGSGSYSISGSTYGVDSRLSGWTYGYTVS